MSTEAKLMANMQAALDKAMVSTPRATYAALSGGEQAITTSYVPNEWSETPRVCQHGNLARQCELCEFEAELAERDKRIAELEAALYVARKESAAALNIAQAARITELEGALHGLIGLIQLIHASGRIDNETLKNHRLICALEVLWDLSNRCGLDDPGWADEKHAEMRKNEEDSYDCN